MSWDGPRGCRRGGAARPSSGERPVRRVRSRGRGSSGLARAARAHEDRHPSGGGGGRGGTGDRGRSGEGRRGREDGGSQEHAGVAAIVLRRTLGVGRHAAAGVADRHVDAGYGVAGVPPVDGRRDGTPDPREGQSDDQDRRDGPPQPGCGPIRHGCIGARLARPCQWTLCPPRGTLRRPILTPASPAPPADLRPGPRSAPSRRGGGVGPAPASRLSSASSSPWDAAASAPNAGFAFTRRVP